MEVCFPSKQTIVCSLKENIKLSSWIRGNEKVINAVADVFANTTIELENIEKLCKDAVHKADPDLCRSIVILKENLSKALLDSQDVLFSDELPEWV